MPVPAQRLSNKCRVLDLGKGDTVRSLAAACSDIDILGHQRHPGRKLQAIDETRWRAAWDLKVFGYINLCRAVYPALKAKGGGVIVNVLAPPAAADLGLHRRQCRQRRADGLHPRHGRRRP